jgi:hypothetical protein
MRQQLGVAALLVLPLVSSAQSLAIQPGGWEMTHRTLIDGKAETIVEKSCVRKSDLDRMDAFVKSEGCAYNFSSRTPMRWALNGTCLQGDAKAMTDIDLTVGSPESIAMKVATQITRGSSTQSIRVDTTGRWRSASCAGFDE